MCANKKDTKNNNKISYVHIDLLRANFLLKIKSNGVDWQCALLQFLAKESAKIGFCANTEIYLSMDCNMYCSYFFFFSREIDKYKYDV